MFKVVNLSEKPMSQSHGNVPVVNDYKSGHHAVLMNVCIRLHIALKQLHDQRKSTSLLRREVCRLIAQNTILRNDSENFSIFSFFSFLYLVDP